MYNDKTLVCKDCGQEFTFTAREQEFYAEKGFTNEPQLCLKPAVTHAKKPPAAPARCTTPCAPAAEKPARFRSSRMGTCSATNASKNPDNNEKARSALFSFSVNTHCMSQTPIRLFFLPPPRRRGKTFPLSTKRFARAIGATPRIPSAKRRWEQKWRDNFRAACYTGRKSKERIA